jgi:hypothetical protein
MISIDLDPQTGLPKALNKTALGDGAFKLEDHPAGHNGKKLKVAMSASLPFSP